MGNIMRTSPANGHEENEISTSGSKARCRQRQPNQTFVGGGDPVSNGDYRVNEEHAERKKPDIARGTPGEEMLGVGLEALEGKGQVSPINECKEDKREDPSTCRREAGGGQGPTSPTFGVGSAISKGARWENSANEHEENEGEVPPRSRDSTERRQRTTNQAFIDGRDHNSCGDDGMNEGTETSPGRVRAQQEDHGEGIVEGNLDGADPSPSQSPLVVSGPTVLENTDSGSAIGGDDERQDVDDWPIVNKAALEPFDNPLGLLQDSEEFGGVEASSSPQTEESEDCESAVDYNGSASVTWHPGSVDGGGKGGENDVLLEGVSDGRDEARGEGATGLEVNEVDTDHGDEPHVDPVVGLEGETFEFARQIQYRQSLPAPSSSVETLPDMQFCPETREEERRGVGKPEGISSSSTLIPEDVKDSGVEKEPT
ncbi:hypothetical protein CC1G_07996 [Coprinopsis cinerea okayama7|uniref:Uncharacterized protein n=1 Tax=Coprinopsis cinerea (strain Okayama-7 / 130 / ATCC MYA-4618 / FGSC 9003) TaxID=240176 RepID=A8NQ65_COPC7|nr:hypothetical protein CC1G_07996 [Coprinopsis cinerea okayama7\|eukprot:XP_001835487.2 hypothetical protein CC1G_07996 [Coprinopsis cinerea okayama7\